jgi:hypothetical protein
MRIMKVVRERNNLIRYISDILRINAGFERFIFFIILSIILCHISACFWYIIYTIIMFYRVLIAKFDDINP